MNRNGHGRAASGSAKESMRHAAEVVGPYAMSAKDSAAHYAHEAGAYLRPRARRAREAARESYEAHLAPRLAEARQNLPEGVDEAATRAADRTREAARRARETAGPQLERARAATGPAREKAATRSAAAMAAIRADLTPRDIQRMVRRRDRRARMGKAVKWLGLTGLLAGGAGAAWRWWDRQTNPEWLVEPPPATEAGDSIFAEPVGENEEERPESLGDPERESGAAAPSEEESDRR